MISIAKIMAHNKVDVSEDAAGEEVAFAGRS
jgi:hypothetical protein